ncbi:MAG: hypothetical protein HC905_10550 [Bacteroidales bacterium]|nr:hypothetical protein [Bacteroidales bacterium]
MHHWRQADCASLALMYYQNGMNFFEPQTHNLTSDSGKTGYVAPSEVPLLYYFIAILYKIFGYHDFIFRLVNTLIFLTGLYYLFRWILLVTKSTFWGIAGSLLFFTSPVLVYYGNNFLTNSASLAFSIVGWYLFFLYRENSKVKHFYLSIAIFGLASCMKITAGFSFFALFGIFFLDKLKIMRLPQPAFPKGILPWISFAFALLIPVSWIVYAHYYNQQHTTGYFQQALSHTGVLQRITFNM